MSEVKPPVPKTTPVRGDAVPRTVAVKAAKNPPVLAPDFGEKPAAKKNRVDFRSEEFERAIRQHGKFVTWRKALNCPCITEKTNQADINCTLCNSSGWFYVDPIQIQALVLSSDKATRFFERFTIWTNGATSLTVDPQYRLGYRDSIELRDTVMTFSEVIKKGNRRGIRAKLPTGVDSCRYRAVSIVHAVFKSSAGEAVPIEETTHFTLNEHGWISWTPAGNALVPAGTFVSVRYEFHPVYIIESFPHVHRDDVSQRKSSLERAIALPVQAAAKLDYLLDVNTQLPSTGS